MSPMFSLVFSGVSIMMVVAGFFMFYRAFRQWRTLRDLAERGERVRGTVTSSYVRIEENSKGNDVHRLVEIVEFHTLAGQKVRGRPRFNDVGLADRTGQTVQIIYSKDNPELFLAPKDGKQQSSGVVVTSAVVGVVFIAVGAVLLFVGSSLPSMP
ncbi:hypothetical protein B842_04665 [Corynebacterium humireducens NBRC 106098 = DSM 45392]|uniref:DUF3592 domain-containing protein n=1 Tax=Corynebacterium humireducens NBRC 106098 = DSM 45392 TaxID=1223515 RepID=A0A0B5D288_9CORY|nr:DUF3592 domain-containing protein [Corynebacterium humireducens]AJE32786.1 hypothetical protein B842_04665 [Corynebacterium humireducens NBRC 106098 = DSM 45392]